MDVSNIRNRKGLRLDACFHPAPHTGILVLLGHGVTGNMDRPLIKGVSEALAERGLPCLRFSFAGNGKSEGRFEEATITSETEDLVDLLNVFATPARRVVYVGHSMGAAVGALVAADEPKRIQVLVSLAGMVHAGEFFRREFSDAKPGAGYMWNEPNCPLSQQAWDDAHAVGDTLAAAAKVTQPWLLIHGTDDDVVPLSDSKAALAASKTPSKLVEMPGDGHMFSEPSYEKIADAISEWIGRNL